MASAIRAIAHCMFHQQEKTSWEGLTHAGDCGGDVAWIFACWWCARCGTGVNIEVVEKVGRPPCQICNGTWED